VKCRYLKNNLFSQLLHLSCIHLRDSTYTARDRNRERDIYEMLNLPHMEVNKIPLLCYFESAPAKERERDPEPRVGKCDEYQNYSIDDDYVKRNSR
jgi:hypothetical protein